MRGKVLRRLPGQPTSGEHSSAGARPERVLWQVREARSCRKGQVLGLAEVPVPLGAWVDPRLQSGLKSMQCLRHSPVPAAGSSAG